MDTRPAGKTREDFTDIIVSVHGIGAQERNSTVRQVATRLAGCLALGREGSAQPLAPQSLGYFHTDIQGAVNVCPLDPDTSGYESLGFTEVFWADIPQEVDREGRTLEEAKAWARTVVARARRVMPERLQTKKPAPPPRPRDSAKAHPPAEGGKVENGNRTAAEEKRDLYLTRPPEFDTAGDVLEEMIETIQVLENLTWLGSRMGLPKFQLRQVLDEFLGDVQIVTEFTVFRQGIIGRFHAAMEHVHKTYPAARIYIVAHSEGTVISFLALLHAMARESVRINPGGRSSIATCSAAPRWLDKVRGYMTLGSPLDKHLLLWPRLFEKFKHATTLHRMRIPIQWRNYYDKGDPVGFKLDTVREFLGIEGAPGEVVTRNPNFEFDGDKHDIGFARYPLPGVAHIGYWDDPEVFEHFVREVILPLRHEDACARYVKERRHYNEELARYKADPHCGEKAPPQVPEVPKVPPAAVRPRDRLRVRWISPYLPFLLSLVILFLGLFILCRAVEGFIHPEQAPLQKYVRFQMLGTGPDRTVTRLQLMSNTVGITCLIAGMTLLARLPRLNRNASAWALALALFVAGAAGYAALVDNRSLNQYGAVFIKDDADTDQAWRNGALAGILGFSLLGGLIGYALTFRRSRRDRFFLFRGMRPLVLCGTGGICFVVATNLYPETFDLTPDLLGQAPEILSENNNYPRSPATLTPADRRGLQFPTDHQRREINQLPADQREELNSLKPAHWEQINMLDAGQRQRIRDLKLCPRELASLVISVANAVAKTPMPPVWERLVSAWTRRQDRRVFSVLPILNAVSPDYPATTRGRFSKALDEKLRAVVEAGETRSPVWPVILALGASIYLWWLATLIFDMGYVWNRYVRNELGPKALRALYHEKQEEKLARQKVKQERLEAGYDG